MAKEFGVNLQMLKDLCEDGQDNTEVRRDLSYPADEI